jgi:hypothetical protein
MATAVKDRTGGLVRTHVITGWPAQVQAALQRAQADGRLVRVDEMTELADEQVQVTAQLREDRARRFAWLTRLPWPSAQFWAQLAVWVLGLAAVAGVVWALVAAVSALVSAAVAVVSAYWPALVGIAVVLVLLGTASGAKRCVGMHCGGCRR